MDHRLEEVLEILAELGLRGDTMDAINAGLEMGLLDVGEWNLYGALSQEA